MNIFKKFFSKESPEPSFTTKLKTGFNNTAQKINNNITTIFTHTKLDDDMLQEFEDLLLSCDFGLSVTQKIIEKIKSQKYEKNLSHKDIMVILRDTIEGIMAPSVCEFLPNLSFKPFVILFVGVNGSGKTTTIGKLASKFVNQGKKIMFAAGDTFRAAASEQLNIWGSKLGAEVFTSKTGNDPASIAFEAYKEAKNKNIDILFIDTAGRLQNKTELMQELAKIIRVIQKLDASAPHCVLQTLDGNVGQNAISQVEQFKDIANVTGLIMTKLDGTARGGILAAVAQKFSLPIYFIGIGEKVEDLRAFSAKNYANAICGIEE